MSTVCGVESLEERSLKFIFILVRPRCDICFDLIKTSDNIYSWKRIVWRLAFQICEVCSVAISLSFWLTIDMKHTTLPFDIRPNWVHQLHCFIWTQWHWIKTIKGQLSLDDWSHWLQTSLARVLNFMAGGSNITWWSCLSCSSSSAAYNCAWSAAVLSGIKKLCSPR